MPDNRMAIGPSFFRRIMCRIRNLLRMINGKGPLLSCWFMNNKRIADHIKWQFEYSNSVYEVEENEKKKWSDWSSEQKLKLQHEFDRAWDWLNNQNGSFDPVNEGLSYPPQNVYDTSNENGAPFTAVTNEYAWELYVRWIAFQLAVEIGNYVPWTVLELPDSELELLLDSSALMRKFSLGYMVATGSPTHSNHDSIEKNFGTSLIAPPWYTFAFLKNNNIIGQSISDTINNLIDWSSENLIHYFGAFNYQNTENHWQYRGNPPITRIIEGTTFSGNNQFRHWTAGCHGTAGFFRNVFRAVNLPVYIPLICNHAQIYFPTEGTYIDHGDNPYNNNFKNSDLPAEYLLIDEDTHEQWFGVGENNRQVGCEYIGGQVKSI